MRQALAAAADSNGFIELPSFIATALYASEIGYYAQDRTRVGRQRGADFFTATSLRPAFAAIVAEAAERALRSAGLEPGETDWIEIGAEPGEALLRDESHPFRSIRTIRMGEPLELGGQAVVFSNELFDAQPFRQLRFANGQWREFGVAIESEALAWRERIELHAECSRWSAALPPVAADGYTIDLPTGARALADEVAKKDWSGVFIAFDYGKTWRSLVEESPQGTARSYRRHRMTGDILDNPGEQDITHHICWDDMEAALSSHGFADIALQSQEAFIAHRAPSFLRKVFDPSLSPLDPLRTKLKELMHPALMGQKFQALVAIRRSQ